MTEKKYDVNHLFSECAKVQSLEKANNALKESYEQGQPTDVKAMARQLHTQLMETGHKLSDEGEHLLSKLQTDGMKIQVTKTHSTKLQVNQKINEKESVHSSSQLKKELMPKQSSSLPQKAEMSSTQKADDQTPHPMSGNFSKTYNVRSEGDVGPTKETILKDELERTKEEIKTLEDRLKEQAKISDENEKKWKEKKKEEIKKLEDQLKEQAECVKKWYEKYDKLEKNYNQSKEDVTVLNNKLQNTEKENTDLKQKLQTEEHDYTQLAIKGDEQKAYIKDLKKKLNEVYENFSRKTKEDEIRFDSLKKEHQELKDRFSKVAGAKLQDGNPDITDLSDPNRAMKLEGRFSALYDDEWTDAFQAQTDVLKKSTKDAIQNLLDVLGKCYEFCKDVAEQQMDSLRMVFLHPVQDLCQTAMAKKDRPRIASKEDKTLKDLRKQIGTQSTNEVKQQFIAKMSQEYKKSEESKKAMGASKEYFEKCAEICWMMVLHDPPLYMDLSIKSGDKINLNYYRVYSTNGEKADFLVWPPLHISGGGLLAKGVVEPVKKKK